MKTKTIAELGTTLVASITDAEFDQTVASLDTVGQVESMQADIVAKWKEAEDDSPVAKLMALRYAKLMIQKKKINGYAEKVTPKILEVKDAVAECQKLGMLSNSSDSIKPILALNWTLSLPEILSVIFAGLRKTVLDKYAPTLTPTDLTLFTLVIDGIIDAKIKSRLVGHRAGTFLKAYHEACAELHVPGVPQLPADKALLQAYKDEKALKQTVVDPPALTEAGPEIKTKTKKAKAVTPSHGWIDVSALEVTVPKSSGLTEWIGRPIRSISSSVQHGMQAFTKKEVASWKKLGVEIPPSVSDHNYLLALLSQPGGSLEFGGVMHWIEVHASTLSIRLVGEEVVA